MIPDRTERLTAALALSSACLALTTIVAIPVLPGTDAPTNTMVAWVAANPEVFADYFEFKWAPTSQGFDFVTFLLLSALPLFAAAKTALALFAGLLIASSGVVTKRAGGSPWLAVALASAFSVGWIFAMGFYNFFSGLALGLFGVALLAVPAPRLGTRIAASCIFLAACFGHFVAAGLIGLHTLLVRGLVSPEARGRELLRDVLTWLPAGAMALIPLVGLLGGGEGPRFDVPPDAMPDPLPFLLEGAFGGFSALGWVVPCGLAAALVAAPPTRKDRLVTTAMLCAVGLIVLLPVHVAGWGFAKPRPMFLALVAWPALLAFDGARGRVARLIVTAACLIATAANSHGAFGESRRLAEWIANYGEVPSGTTFEANFHPEPAGRAGPGVRPGIGIPHYATRHGGTTPGAFATNPIMHSTLFVGGGGELFPSTPLLAMIIPEECRQDAECYRGHAFRADVLATMAVHWDSVALVDPPEGVLDGLRERQMVPLAPWLWTAGIGDFRGELAPGFRGPIAWQLGYLDTVGVISSGAANITADGMVLRVTGIPSGPTFVRVHRDPNQDGTYQDGEEIIFQQSVILNAGEPTPVALR